MSVSKGFTASDIAAEARVPLSRVQYVIRSRRVEEADRVGVFRLFDESDRQFILAELRRMNGTKEGER